MRFDITILGSNSALPTGGRFPTAQFLTVHNESFLVDCGEGTQMRIEALNLRKSRVRAIFISHLHGDHFFGLFGVLASYALGGRTEPLHIYAPQGMQDIITTIYKYSGLTGSPYPLHIHEIEDAKVSQIIYEDSLVSVQTIPLQHRIPTCGFLFCEKPQPLRFIKEKAEEYNIPVTQITDIKKGSDFVTPDGQIIPNNKLTMQPSPPRSYAFCSDTQYHEAIIPLIQGVDLLYHEATFLHLDKKRADETGHSTAIEAATIAKKASVGRLLIGHFSNRYQNLAPLLAEARSIFEHTDLATEGLCFEILKDDL
jgi:ribonuclease Z